MWLLFLISFLLIIVEKGFLSVLFVSGYIPQLLTINIILMALWKVKNTTDGISLTQFAVVIFLSGIIYDIFSGNYLGLSAFSNLNTFLLVLALGKILSGRGGLVSLPLSLIIGTIFYNSVWVLFYRLIGQDFNFDLKDYYVQITSINLVVGIIMSILGSKIIDKIIGKDEIEIR